MLPVHGRLKRKIFISVIFHNVRRALEVHVHDVDNVFSGVTESSGNMCPFSVSRSLQQQHLTAAEAA